MKLIVCNAAIGGGKTELANLISKSLREVDGKKVVIIDERVDSVENVSGENLLKNFYENPGRWSFTMQFFYLISRINYCNGVMESNGEDSIFIMERDWFADKYCFAETLYKDGFMTKAEWFAYQDTFNYLVNTSNVPKVDGYIFIDCSVNTHMERIKRRARDGESGIKREYEEELVNKHKRMRKEYIDKGIPVMSIDGEKNFKDDPVVQMDTIRVVEEFIRSV